MGFALLLALLVDCCACLVLWNTLFDVVCSALVCSVVCCNDALLRETTLVR